MKQDSRDDCMVETRFNMADRMVNDSADLTTFDSPVLTAFDVAIFIVGIVALFAFLIWRCRHTILMAIMWCAQTMLRFGDESEDEVSEQTPVITSQPRSANYASTASTQDVTPARPARPLSSPIWIAGNSTPLTFNFHCNTCNPPPRMRVRDHSEVDGSGQDPVEGDEECRQCLSESARRQEVGSCGTAEEVQNTDELSER